MKIKNIFSLFVITLLLPLAEVMPAIRPIRPTGVSLDRMTTEVLWHSLRKLDVGDRPRNVLVLGAGGARGLSHIGVLRVLEQEKIPVDFIIGVSVGALIGALYAGGMSVDEIELMAEEVGWKELSNLTKAGIFELILKERLLSTKKMETYLEAHLGKKNFSDLKIPFVCIATDIRTGERVVLKEGPVAIAARASATVPGIFEPVNYQGRLLVDGGLVENLPSDLAPNDGRNFLIGVLPKVDFSDFEVTSVLKTLVRSIEIQKRVIVEEDKKIADFIIEPEMETFSIVELGRNVEAMESGVLATQKSATELKKKIIQRTMVLRKKNRKKKR